VFRLHTLSITKLDLGGCRGARSRPSLHLVRTGNPEKSLGYPGSAALRCRSLGVHSAARRGSSANMERLRIGVQDTALSRKPT
jgi:hypothetical protein